MGGMADDPAPLMPEISLLAAAIFGDGAESIATVAVRAHVLLPHRDHRGWGGDPATSETVGEAHLPARRRFPELPAA
jgi:hypothetical protein